jgi:NADPH:quinone reductase-like Zn-dependent oxidoreductase
MKAARFHKTGGPEVLIYEDVPDPAPGAGQILLKVEAAGVNYVDIMRRRGDPLHEPTPLPFIVGYEMAGTVAGLSAGVTSPALGVKVFVNGRVLPLSQAAAAHRLVEERKSTGKVVLLPWDRPESSAVLGRGNWRWFGRGLG